MCLIITFLCVFRILRSNISIILKMMVNLFQFFSLFQNPVTYTSFDCLSVPIPASVFGTISLEYLLEKFTQMELVHDVECAECSKRLSAEISSPSMNSIEISSPNGVIEHSELSSACSTETLPNGISSPKCHRIFRKQMTIGKVCITLKKKRN